MYFTRNTQHIKPWAIIIWYYWNPHGPLYSLCGSLRLTAIGCYQDQAPLSPLIPNSPPLPSQSPGSLQPGRGARLMGSSGNPNPHYLPHYSSLYNGNLFLGFHPFARENTSAHTDTHTHTHTHTHTCPNAPHALVRLFLFLRALSLSLWSKTLVIRCLLFFVCAFVLGDKDRLSPPSSLFFLSFLKSTPLFFLPQCSKLFLLLL